MSLPLRHEDLIEPVKETVAFVEGGDLVLEVKKLGGTIKEIYWECNGVRISAKDDGIKIANGSKYHIITWVGVELGVYLVCIAGSGTVWYCFSTILASSVSVW